MEVILQKVLRQRSICGSLLKNWLITEAVLMNGSMSRTEPIPFDILTISNQLLSVILKSFISTSRNHFQKPVVFTVVNIKYNQCLLLFWLKSYQFMDRIVFLKTFQLPMGVREVRFKHREAKHSLLIIQNMYFPEALPKIKEEVLVNRS